MNATIEIGEWVEGPFAGTVIEGFIVKKSYYHFHVLVTNIKETDSLPPRLTKHSVHEIPKRSIKNSFICLNKEQQNDLIDFALAKRDINWVKELVTKFQR